MLIDRHLPEGDKARYNDHDWIVAGSDESQLRLTSPDLLWLAVITIGGGRSIEMEYRIRCPYHEADEVLEVPGDPQYHEGMAECSPAPGLTPRPIRIRIIHGLLIDAAPVKSHSSQGS